MMQTMMKFGLLLFFVVLLITINGEQKILSISSGTSFGMCVDYCRRSVNITSNPSQMIGLKEANYVYIESKKINK
jgi:hypothetical protein